MRKHVHIYLVLLLCFGLVACNIQSDFKDKNLRPTIAEDAMVNILADIHIAETLVKDNILKRDSFRFESLDNYYASIFTIHEVTEEEFEQSLEFYISHPVEMEGIYIKVEEKLEEYVRIKPKSSSKKSKEKAAKKGESEKEKPKSAKSPKLPNK